MGEEGTRGIDFTQWREENEHLRKSLERECTTTRPSSPENPMYLVHTSQSYGLHNLRDYLSPED